MNVASEKEVSFIFQGSDWKKDVRFPSRGEGFSYIFHCKRGTILPARGVLSSFYDCAAKMYRFPQFVEESYTSSASEVLKDVRFFPPGSPARFSIQRLRLELEVSGRWMFLE